MAKLISRIRKFLLEMYGYTEPSDTELTKSLHRIQLGLGSGLDMLRGDDDQTWQEVMGDPIRRRR